jgi:hypothetical protein
MADFERNSNFVVIANGAEVDFFGFLTINPVV